MQEILLAWKNASNEFQALKRIAPAFNSHLYAIGNIY